MNKKFINLPISYFSITLGLFALGLAWKQFEQSKQLSNIISSSLLASTSIIWLLFILLYLIKIIARQESVKNEFLNQIQCCFFSLLPITLLLFSLSIKPFILPSISTSLIFIGTILQLAFSTYRAAGLWKGNHPFDATTPILYLPTVAANFVSAIALTSLSLTQYAVIFFGMGMISWITLEPAILQRLRNSSSIEEGLRPTLGIQLAPAFVAANTYLHIVDGHIDYFVLAIIGYGMLQLLFLFRLLPWIINSSFKISLWAFSFGAAAMATVGVYLIHTTEFQLDILGYLFFILGNIIIIFLTLGTLKQLITGKFFPIQ